MIRLIRTLGDRVWSTRAPRRSAGAHVGPPDGQDGPLEHGWENRQRALEATEELFWGTSNQGVVEAILQSNVEEGAVCRIAAPALVVLASAHLDRGDTWPFSHLAALAMHLRQHMAHRPEAVRLVAAQAIDGALAALWRSDISDGKREQIAKIWVAAGAGLPPLVDSRGVGG